MFSSAFRVPTVEEIREARKKRPVAIMLTVYGDESHEGEKRKVFAVAGIIGTDEQWDSFDAIWLARTGGKIFHAADCETDKGDFKGIPHDVNLEFVKDLTQILIKSPMKGFATAIDIEACRDLIPHFLETDLYFRCFAPVVLLFARMAHDYNPPQQVRFLFDRNDETEFLSIKLVEYFASLKKYPFSAFIDDCGFASKKKPGIQAADLIAREAMKDLDNILHPKRDRRRSMTALLESKKFGFRFWDRQSFEEHIEDLPEIEKQIGMRWDDYENWCQKESCSDNAGERMRYAFEWQKGKLKPTPN